MDNILTAQLLAIAASIIWVTQQIKANTYVSKYTEYLPFAVLGMGVGAGFLFDLGQGSVPGDVLSGLIAGAIAIAGYKSGKTPAEVVQEMLPTEDTKQ